MSNVTCMRVLFKNYIHKLDSSYLDYKRIPPYKVVYDSSFSWTVVWREFNF